MNAAGRILFVIYAAPIAYSHGVAVLSSILKKAGFHTDIFIANGNLELFKTIISENWAAICFSNCIKKDFDLSIKYIDAAIESGHETILGGTYHRRNNPNKYDGVLKICRGDGETLTDYFIGGNAAVFDKRLVQQDLDCLPMADYEIFKNIPFDGHIKDFPEMKKLPYTVSRGCIGKCKFCEVQHQEGGVRIRRSSVDDIKYLTNRYNPDLLFFTDELFPYYDQRYMEDFLPSIKKPYFAFIRADIKADMLKNMISSGMIGCAFGVECGDEKYRNDILCKGITDEEVHRTAGILKSNGTYFAHFYMINMEGESFMMKKKTDDMAMSLGGTPMVFDYTAVKYQTRGC
jgi:radical SAM superfamily enzyme YgiQ (UPF0313 family)